LIVSGKGPFPDVSHASLADAALFITTAGRTDGRPRTGTFCRRLVLGGRALAEHGSEVLAVVALVAVAASFLVRVGAAAAG
jgi:hypothetical protein